MWIPTLTDGLFLHLICVWRSRGRCRGRSSGLGMDLIWVLESRPWREQWGCVEFTQLSPAFIHVTFSHTGMSTQAETPGCRGTIFYTLIEKMWSSRASLTTGRAGARAVSGWRKHSRCCTGGIPHCQLQPVYPPDAASRTVSDPGTSEQAEREREKRWNKTQRPSQPHRI